MGATGQTNDGGIGFYVQSPTLRSIRFYSAFTAIPVISNADSVTELVATQAR